MLPFDNSTLLPDWINTAIKQNMTVSLYCPRAVLQEIVRKQLFATSKFEL